MSVYIYIYIYESTRIISVIITFLFYFCMTSEGRSINPYCGDMCNLVIYLWRASRMLDTIWTAAEEIHVQKHFLVV